MASLLHLGLKVRAGKGKYDYMDLNGNNIAFNKDGAALVIVLLVLTAISILGVMSINTSAVELDITRNEREIGEIFYLSESAAMEGMQRLVDSPLIDLEEKVQFWHHSDETARTGNISFRDPQKWDIDGQGEDNGMQSTLDPNVYFAAVEHRLATGSSAIVTESRLYMNRVYGLSNKYNAANIVEIGFYLRYR
jgi:hypothetical protein